LTQHPAGRATACRWQAEATKFQGPKSQKARGFLLFCVREGMRERDLKERTFQFAREVRDFLKVMPKMAGNVEDGRQLQRSSGSIGANYLEADNALSRRDSLMRMRICLKESRESEYWLRLLDLSVKPELLDRRASLMQESAELARIFATICRKMAR
jgi:four helix bundle protein